MTWRRSSYCDAGACIEVAATAGAILVRDSKDPNGPVLHFGEQPWRAFLASTKAGDFDLP